MKNRKNEENKPQNKKPIRRVSNNNKKIVKIEDKKIDNKQAVVKQLKEKLSLVDLKDKSKLVDNILIVLIGLQIIALVYLLVK